MATAQAPPENLSDALVRAARRHPERGIGLLDGRGRPGERLTFPDLLARARSQAARLAAMGIGPGEPFLVCLPTSFEFLETWFGGILAGAWPIATAVPGSLGSSEHQLRRLGETMEHLEAERIVCRAPWIEEARRFGLDAFVSRAITPEELAQATEAALAEGAPTTGADTAFLQLTSGSTGRPRAARITHRGALHNPAAMNEAIGSPHGGYVTDSIESMVSWLPLNHDMGLVGALLSSVVCGFDLWLASPRTFLGRPHTWLRSLSAHGRSITTAPNFAYQTCVERVSPEELRGADLSLLRAAMVGAEMVRPDTMRAFAERFAPLGFDARALVPCYGMAEATLALTFDVRGEGIRTHSVPPSGTQGELAHVVSVGQAVRDTELRIVAPDGRRLAQGQTGEICARGPSIFAGYYRDEDATAEALRDGWLHTGDIGFMLDDELYISGRVKDLIIVHGQNLMPHELEWVAESVSGGGGALRSGAFSIARGGQGEVPILAVEVDEAAPGRLDELEREIRRRMGRQLSIPLAEVIFVRRGKLPRTTSGKVQRSELKRRYADGQLERIGSALADR